jgi:creatinine amidohydrolase
MPAAVAEHFPFDHAGEGETALMLALCPELVEPDRMAENDTWYTASAATATTTQGQAGLAVILRHLKDKLSL